MVFVLDGFVLGIVMIIAIIAICGGATAIAGFIVSHMTGILIGVSVLFLASLIFYWLGINETLEKKIYKIIVMIISFAETVLSVFALREWMLHFVECQETMGFFAFGFEVILSSIFCILPIFGTKLAAMTVAAGADEMKREGSKFALITILQVGFILLIIGGLPQNF